MNKHTEETALTAMCLWEALVTNYLTSQSSSNAYLIKLEEVGTCQLRSIVLNTLAPAVEVAYSAVSDSYDEPFDWEFVPVFLRFAEPVLACGLFAISTPDAKGIGQKILKEKRK